VDNLRTDHNRIRDFCTCDQTFLDNSRREAGSKDRYRPGGEDLRRGIERLRAVDTDNSWPDYMVARKGGKRQLHDSAWDFTVLLFCSAGIHGPPAFQLHLGAGR
jgi:hypothetical protein